MWIGSQHPEYPYLEIGQVATTFYFAWFIVLVPVIGIIENTLFDISLNSNSIVKSQSQPKTNLPLTPHLSNSKEGLNKFHFALKGSKRFYSKLNSRSQVEEFDKNISLDQAKLLLSDKKELFQLPDNFNFNNFRQLANGVFQAEGHIGCRIKPEVGNFFFPIFNLVQNFSEESLNFFLMLWVVLDKKCSLNVRLSSSGKLIIALSSESWSHISYLKDYFNQCYGEKHINFTKLEDIRKLSLSKNKINIALAASLSYNLSLVGNPKVYQLDDILTKLGLDGISILTPTEKYSDNQNIPSILNFIGFILGDGILHIKLRKTSSGSINIIPLISVTQVSSEYNKHFMILLGKLFEGLKIPFIFQIYKNTYILQLEGKESVFNKLLPLLTPYSHLFFWKSANLKLFKLVRLFMASRIHLNLIGLNRILELCFNYPNERTNTLAYWKEIASTYYREVDSKNLSGYHLIRPVYSRDPSSNKNIVAWLVYSPLNFYLGGKLEFKSKQFGFKNRIDQIKSLKEAVAYRDTQITNIINLIESDFNLKK
jgi:hypothetical protein